MPFVDLPEVRLHYQFEGDPHLPVLMLSNSLGTHLGMWTPQMSALRAQFRVLRYDTRGHGQSSVPEGDYTIDQLGRDALGLMYALDIERVYFCGLSMGALTGLWLATHHPERIARLVLCNSAPKVGTAEVWNERIATVRKEGVKPLIPSIVDRWFTKRFQARSPEPVAEIVAMLDKTPAAGYANCSAAIRDTDFRNDLARIELPTLVVGGAHDGSTPPAQTRAIADGIDGARYVELDSAHLSNWEQAGAFTVALIEFLSDAGLSDAARYCAGTAVRRAVLGDAHVDRAHAKLDPFNTEFQHLIARHAWGDIWTRPGLGRRERSLITVAMLVAQGHETELRYHLRGALNNDVTRDEIKEVLLQSAIYCGVPAANTGFQIAQEVFREIDAA